MNTASNHSIYARWTANTYTVTFNRTNFGNGEVVYFNPVTAQVCDASEAISTTGYKDGCMKWYTFLDDGGETIKLLLDHNTTAQIDLNNNDSILFAAYDQLEIDTVNWDEQIKTRARFISAIEVNQIAPSNNKWDKNDEKTNYSLHTGSQPAELMDKGINKYSWLFNYTKNCEEYGCDYTDDMTYGYWTSDSIDDTDVWGIFHGGNLHTSKNFFDSSKLGIRPVVEISKDLISIEKKIVYNEIFGDLPLPEKVGYTFTGWYTTGGVEITSTSNVSITFNQVLYPQWSPNTYIVKFENLNQTKSVIYGEEYGELPIPSKNGYIFLGWYDSKMDGRKIESTSLYDFPKDQILYSHWKFIGSITNLMADGSFENGISGWYNKNENTTFEENTKYKYHGYKSFMIEMTDTQAWPRYNYIFENIEGHIIYVSVRTYTDNEIFSAGLQVISTETNEHWSTAYESKRVGSIETKDIWKKASLTLKVSSPYIKIMLPQTSSSGTGKVYFDGLMLVDLTETFGAGNEPNEHWCHLNIDFFENTIDVNYNVNNY